MMPHRRGHRSTPAVRRFSAARHFRALFAVALVIAIPTAAWAQTPPPAAADDPFATPAEKASTTAAPEAANPFATSEELRVNRQSLLMNRQPLDVIVLKERPPREEEILPLDQSQRKVLAAANPDVVLRVRLRSDPHTEYFLAPRDIVEIRFFESRVLKEAGALARSGRFDDAFDVFTFLRQRYPALIGLAEAEQEYVILEAQHAIAQKRWESALASAWRLNELKPRHPRLVDILTPAVEGVVADRLSHNNPTAARRAVEQLASYYPGHAVTVRLQKLLVDTVASNLEQARKCAAEQDWARCQTLLNMALGLEPESKPAQSLLAEAVAKYPRVIVGVGAFGAPAGSAGLVDSYRGHSALGDDWSERRVARLLAPPALELAAAADGASLEYRSGWARWTTNPRDDALHELQVPPGFAYRTAEALLAAGNHSTATFRPAWQERQVRISVRDDEHIDLEFAKRHPRTEALAAAVLDDAVTAGAIADPIDSSYALSPVAAADAGSSRFVRTSPAKPDAATTAMQPVEIMERHFADEDAAVAALRFGEVDVVDRIAPWHLAGLRETREVRLVRYVPLSVHCLCVRSGHPLLAKQEFRRALLYALDREAILRNHLHIADAADGSRTARGIFSSGRSPEDPLGYASNPAIAPRAYDPQAAFILARLVMPAKAAAALRSQPLILAHPPTAVATRACEQIRLQWSRIGVAVELRALKANAPSADDADLVYTVVSAPEPLIDAERLLGPEGIVPTAEQRALAGPLRQLSDSATFAEARTALFEIQRVVHEQTLVLPLWQLNEYAARRTRVTMSATPPLSLYQFVAQWRTTAGVNEPLP
ncbi:MAG: hypothetical protein C0483_14010 [Pirellula sp.]|nr:hypothetical protein [Pirellula sp.]